MKSFCILSFFFASFLILPMGIKAQSLYQKVEKRVKESAPKHKNTGGTNSVSTGAQAAAVATQKANIEVEQQQATTEQMRATNYTQQLKINQGVRPSSSQNKPCIRTLTTYSSQNKTTTNSDPSKTKDTPKAIEITNQGQKKLKAFDQFGGAGFNTPGGNGRGPADPIDFEKKQEEPAAIPTKPLKDAIEDAKAAGVKLSLISFVRADEGLDKNKEKKVKDFKLKTGQLGTIIECSAAINYYNNNHDWASENFTIYEAVKIQEGLYTIREVESIR